MATVFARGIISTARVSQKFRLPLSAKKVSCFPPNFYCREQTSIIKRSNKIFKNVKLEPVWCVGIRQFSANSSKPSEECNCKQEEKKLSLFQRFKEMYKKYWYVLVPVHLVTSACWFGGFYYLAERYVIYRPPRRGSFH